MGLLHDHWLELWGQCPCQLSMGWGGVTFISVRLQIPIPGYRMRLVRAGAKAVLRAGGLAFWKVKT